MSYDVQNIEPVAPANVIRKYGVKDESTYHSSNKDSAYGSMETSNNDTIHKSNSKNTLQSDKSNNSRSRSVSAISLQNTTPVSSHVQRFQKSEEVFSKELESMKGSTSTLHSTGNSSRSNSLHVTRNGSLESANPNDIIENDAPSTSKSNPVVTQNGFSPGQNAKESNKNNNPAYISMKNSVYENVGSRNDSLRNRKPENNFEGSQPSESPYTSMLNIVQGQIKISPHSNETNRNVVNVSVTRVNQHKKH